MCYTNFICFHSGGLISEGTDFIPHKILMTHVYHSSLLEAIRDFDNDALECYGVYGNGIFFKLCS